jgi:hypothetical protein
MHQRAAGAVAANSTATGRCTMPTHQHTPPVPGPRPRGYEALPRAVRKKLITEMKVAAKHVRPDVVIQKELVAGTAAQNCNCARCSYSKRGT